MSRNLILAGLAASLAACAQGVEPPVSPRAAAEFNAELAGRSPGRTQSCLPPRSTATVVATNGPTLLFREGNMVWANQTNGGCSALADRSLTLVTENFGGTLCSGSLAKVVDLTANNILRGSCVLGDFTPYRRP